MINKKAFKCFFIFILCVYYCANKNYAYSKDFVFLESTAYDQKSSFYANGFIPIEELGSHLLWENNEDRDKLPNKNKFCRLVRNIKPEYSLVVIDIENWPLSTRWANQEVVNESIEKYKTVIDWAKKCRVDLKFGFYGQIPISDHQLILKGENSKENRFWVQQHDATIELAKAVDALFPSLYTVYDEEYKWEILAKEYIKMARKLANGKPVYAYIWPQYHEGNKEKKGTFINRRFWRKQLELVYELADGAVVWGGWNNGPMKWNENEEWWLETKEFISSKNR